jgi:hypothetical protein
MAFRRWTRLRKQIISELKLNNHRNYINKSLLEDILQKDLKGLHEIKLKIMKKKRELEEIQKTGNMERLYKWFSKDLINGTLFTNVIAEKIRQFDLKHAKKIKVSKEDREFIEKSKGKLLKLIEEILGEKVQSIPKVYLAGSVLVRPIFRVKNLHEFLLSKTPRGFEEFIRNIEKGSLSGLMGFEADGYILKKGKNKAVIFFNQNFVDKRKVLVHEFVHALLIPFKLSNWETLTQYITALFYKGDIPDTGVLSYDLAKAMANNLTKEECKYIFSQVKGLAKDQFSQKYPIMAEINDGLALAMIYKFHLLSKFNPQYRRRIESEMQDISFFSGMLGIKYEDFLSSEVR